MRRRLALLAALLLAAAPAALAQYSTGNIYGMVADESGAAMPGATVTLSAGTGGQSTTTDTQGAFRFLNLSPGHYKLAVNIGGFATMNREVVVSTGNNVSLNFSMKLAGVAETLTVTADTPVIDTKRVGTSTTMSREELSQVPSARDPWAVLRTVPGVIVDRVNIAGNENGQQASFSGKGADRADTMWNLDGVVITDMSAAGASPTYFDYDAFEEIGVTTGGGDLKVQTGGVGLNLVTKRGSNAFHGGARYYLTHDKLQSGNVPDELASDPRLQGSDKADHIDQISDYGFDLGGPLLKDKLWFYGSWGKQDVRIVRLNQTPDKTLLKSYNAKLNWQAGPNPVVSLFHFNGQKLKFGRLGGVGGLQQEAPTTWDQANAYDSPLHGMYKAELNQVFGPSLFLNLRYAFYDSGFGLVPQGGLDEEQVLDFSAGIARGTNYQYLAIRPQHTANLDGSAFRSGWGGNHELKFGFGYRHARTDSTTTYAGSKVQARIRAAGSSARVYRDLVVSYAGDYWNAYLGDTFTKDRLTVNLGVRWDGQKADNLASSAGPNTLFPQQVPGLEFPGGGQGISWSDFSPRIGFTYALDDSRRTVIRGSLARYAGQLSFGNTTQDNPVGISFIEYPWSDLNRDGRVQQGELDLREEAILGNTIDPNDPASVVPFNEIDPSYGSNKDLEGILGFEREVIPSFAVGFAYTYRKSSDITWYPLVGVTGADYVAADPASARGETATFFELRDDVDADGHTILTNRPDYARQYHGLELTLNKRLSNKWMARAALSFNDWTHQFDGSGSRQNPTATLSDIYTPLVSDGANQDGGQVILIGSGSGRTVYYGGKWQFTGSALYQLPSGFELSGSLFSRQGFIQPRYLQVFLGPLEGFANAISTPAIDTDRLPNLWNLDLRLAKNLKIGSSTMTLAADLFNVFNSNTELNRFGDATSTAFNRLDEIQSPRILRFGVRYQF